MTLRCRTDGDALIIDWPATLHDAATNNASHPRSRAPLDVPPEPGLVDDTLGLARARRKGRPATLTITHVAANHGFLHAGTVHLVGTLHDTGDPVDLRVVTVPPYATSACRVGAALPVIVPQARGRVVIDWPAAVVDLDPGRPPGPE